MLCVNMCKYDLPSNFLVLVTNVFLAYLKASPIILEYSLALKDFSLDSISLVQQVDPWGQTSKWSPAKDNEIIDEQDFESDIEKQNKTTFNMGINTASTLTVKLLLYLQELFCLVNPKRLPWHKK